MRIANPSIQLDTIKLPKQELIDSTQQKINSTTRKLNSISNHITDYDTLNAKSRALLDSMRVKVQARIDSAKSKGLSTEKLTNKLDSINRLDPNAKIGQQVAGVNDKARGLQNKLQRRPDQLEEKQKQITSGVNEKLDVLNKESLGNGVLPGNAQPLSAGGPYFWRLC